jgi:hypothetical protein
LTAVAAKRNHEPQDAIALGARGITGDRRLRGQVRKTRTQNRTAFTRRAHRHLGQYPGPFQLTLKLREAGGREFELIFRAYNDGLAFRYVLPKVPGHDMLVVERELTEFAFASDWVCYSGQNARLGFAGSQ